MDKLPDWLAAVNVEFVCNNCPNRQTKNIAFVSLEPNLPPAAKAVVEDVEEVADEEVAEEA
ncbi:MAG: hypothetical protein QOJ65_2685 [Fimbriimonadaceae bacterium]|jgi:flagellar basal body P-ring protein FlgI|nr:hypothetical protein [Fimbriimonadaceae bacterium]